MPIQRDQDLFKPLPPNWWERDFAAPELTRDPVIRPPAPAPEPLSKPKPWLLRLLRRALRILVWPLALLINGGMTAVVGVCAFYLWVVPTLPDDTTLTDIGPQRPLLIYDSEHHLMGEFGAQRREPIRYADTPPLLIKAFLAAEDSRFFEHSGVDPQGLARAALNLVRTGELSQGGSTITMQLVRNLFLTPEKSMQRKLSELALAMHLEARFSKEQIFELYENRIFFGHHAYGVAAAAKIYYNKKIDELTLAQMATLAGIPQAPSIHNPITYMQRSIVRRAYVLGRMLALGWITQGQYDTANTAPEDAHITTASVALDAPYLTEMARKEAYARYGDKVYSFGLQLTTTTDVHLQHLAEQSVVAALIDYDHRHGYRGAEAKLSLAAGREAMDGLLASHPTVQGLDPAIVLSLGANSAHLYLGNGQEGELASDGVAWAIAPSMSKNTDGLKSVLKPGDMIRVGKDSAGKLSLAQIPAVEGALVAISPKDGAIKALVGGFDFSRSQFNRAVDARRQPGSSFKPFVYATALTQGWTPTSIISDSPIQVRNGRHIWRPKNFDGRFLGKIPLRLALAQSRNLAAVQLLRSVGIDAVRSFATRFGFRPEQMPRGLSLALGSGESAPLQMAGAYAVFANGGLRVDPHLIAQIQDTNGRNIFQDNTAKGITVPVSGDTKAAMTLHPGEAVLAPAVTATMLDLLQEVIRSGTAKRALVLKRPDLAGKTGTSNGVRDAWFCGFNPDLVVVTWIGFDDFSPLGRDEVGGHSALDMWIAFMGAALANPPDKAQPSISTPPHVLTGGAMPPAGAGGADAGTNNTDTSGSQETVEDVVTEENNQIPPGVKPPTPQHGGGQPAAPSGTSSAVVPEVDEPWQDDTATPASANGKPPEPAAVTPEPTNDQDPVGP